VARVGCRPGERVLVGALLATAVLGLPARTTAQIDPEPRLNLELGLEGPLRGDGPLSGYAFFLWNQPHFLEEDWYLRVVFAPTYVISDLVRDRWPGPGHAIGFGLGGGFFPYNFDEFRNGSHLEKESFWGHGGESTLSYYRRLKLFDKLPVEGQLRFHPQYVVYQRSGDTDHRFRLPADTAIYSSRVGVRVGGEPPELFPDLAVEVSAWYEASRRQTAEVYGFPEAPIRAESTPQQAWARAGGVFTVSTNQSARLFVTAGTSRDVDALSSYRLGSALPFRREFPLVLHGYYVDEVFASRFWLLNASYRFPLWPGSRRVRLQLSFDYARVGYLEGHALPRRNLRGVGADLSIALTKWATLVLGYGYGWDAPRGRGFGGHEANSLIEFKF
jgi:hypothetical protein